jgi:acyl carrier protein
MNTQLSTDEIDSRLRVVVGFILGIPGTELDENLRFDENYDGDSMTALEITAQIEKEFSVEIADETLPRMVTLTATRAVLLETLATQRS